MVFLLLIIFVNSLELDMIIYIENWKIIIIDIMLIRRSKKVYV